MNNPLETYQEQAREAAADYSAGHYLLSPEQFTRLDVAAIDLVIAELKSLGNGTHYSVRDAAEDRITHYQQLKGEIEK